MNKKNNEIILIGILKKPKGLKGDILIDCFLKDHLKLEYFKNVFVGSKKLEYSIEKINFKGNRVIVKFSRLDDLESIEDLIGEKIFIKRKQLPDLDEDTWYHHDLIGLKVKDANKKYIGNITALYNFGAGDIVEIEYLSGKKEMFPFDEYFVKEIKLENEYVVMEIEDVK